MISDIDLQELEEEDRIMSIDPEYFGREEEK